MESEWKEPDEILVNGSAKMNGTLKKVESVMEPTENIFLFIPNLIGICYCLGT